MGQTGREVARLHDPLAPSRRASPPPWGPPPAPARFATDERVRLALRMVVHLARVGPSRLPLEEAPPQSTQQGIAEALSATQGAVSKVLRRLIAGELVRWERRHVRGRFRRVRVYFLTTQGEQMAEKTRARWPGDHE